MSGHEDRTAAIALAGDAIITQKLSTCTDPGLETLLEPIREADVSIANLEVLLHDYEGYPAAESGGTYMRAPPSMADELTWAGFDCFTLATNHAGDYSHGGMEATIRELDSRGVPYAGLGTNLADARSPTYVDTPAGRIGIVAACSTVVDGTEAGRQRPDIQGRPGISPLRLETRYTVPAEAHDQLQEISEKLGLEAIKHRRGQSGFSAPGEETDAFTFVNVGNDDHLQFERGAEFSVTQRPNQRDVDEILAQIRQANRQADWTIASLHAHEGESGRFNDETVPQFLETFAHECVNAGANIFFGHGPHLLRGIEIYDGAPIFYSLGNFIMQNETVTKLPAEIYEEYDLDPLHAQPAELFDARIFDEDGTRTGFLRDRRFWETVVPVCRLDDGRIESIELYPAALGHRRSRPQRGYPALASDETAERIIADLQSLSAPYGTQIDREEERGIIEIDTEP